MRKFYLRSGAVTKPLNGENGVTLLSPGGLGTSSTDTMYQMLSGFFGRGSTQVAMASITGNLVFRGSDPYTMYRSFTDWALTQKELWLDYEPVPGQRYSRRVYVQSVSKTELDAPWILKIPVVFNCYSPWQIVRTVTGSRIDTTAVGQLPTAYVVRINVPDEQSVIDISSRSGRCLLSFDFHAGDVVELSTLPSDSHITLNGEDISPILNLAYDPFFRTEPGMTEVIQSNIPAEVSIYNYWRTV